MGKEWRRKIVKPIIFIDPGHSDRDPGAVGYETEVELAELVSKHMADYLKTRYECESYVCPSNIDSLAQICKLANDMGAALFVSNHFNAGGGDGYECYVHNESRRELGQLFEKHVKAAGQNSRGVKLRPSLYVLKNTNMPAILNEGAFVDNKADIQDWNDDGELKKLGEAYAKAAAEFLGLKPLAEVKEVPVNLPAIRVQVSLPVLRKGCAGESVKVLQKLIGADADGIFGAMTEAAVIAFQKKHSLAGDGVAGQLTWSKLLGGKTDE